MLIMKLEIYRSNWECRGSVEYTIILNDVLMVRTQMEILTTPVEDTDKVVVNMILHNLANNMEEAITRVINGKKIDELGHQSDLVYWKFIEPQAQKLIRAYKENDCG